MLLNRRKTRKIKLGSVYIGGGAPVSVQSMLSVKISRFPLAIKQIKQLLIAGCEVIRFAVKDEEDLNVIPEIKRRFKQVPFVADIHFRPELAVSAIKNGVDGIRINPGNMPFNKKFYNMLEALKDTQVALRIGVNAGSISKRFLRKFKDFALAMAESALEAVKIFEDAGIENIKISVKAYELEKTFQAYKLLAERTDWPFHIGITEAGTLISGIARSCAGLTLLLASGYGDTIRVSLADNPVKEVIAGFSLLRALNLREDFPELVVCPTCGRKNIDVFNLATKIEKQIAGIRKKIRIAVMGCEVNGPSEAKNADIGIAGVRGGFILFEKGKVVKRLKNNDPVKIIVDFVKQHRED